MSQPPGQPGPEQPAEQPGQPPEQQAPPGQPEAPGQYGPGYGPPGGYGFPGGYGGTGGYGGQSGYGGGYGGPGYGAPGGYGGPGYGYPTGGIPATNGKATASLVVGITSLVLSWCCGLGVIGAVAIVLGVKARGEIRERHGAQGGEGLALAGMITGAVAVVLGLLVLAFLVIAIATGNTEFSTETGTGTQM
jgi:hypothetical protein